MAAARGPTAGGGGCCCCCRGRQSPAQRRCMARSPGSRPEQVTWCRDRPPPEAPPSRPPPARPAAARGATCRRRHCRTRRRQCCSRRRLPRSPSRAPAPPRLLVPVPSLPPPCSLASPPPGRSLRPPGSHPSRQPAPTQVGTDPGPAPSAADPRPVAPLPPAPLPLSFLSSPAPLTRSSFSRSSPLPPFPSPLSPLLSLLYLRNPISLFFSLSPFLSLLLILFLPPAFSLPLPPTPTPFAGRATQFPPVQWVLFGCFFGEGAIPAGRRARLPPGVAPRSGPASSPSGWILTLANLHLSTCRGGAAPCWYGTSPGCAPPCRLAGGRLRAVPEGFVRCRHRSAAALFVLIAQSIRAQKGFVFNLYPRAPASTLEGKENELIRPRQLYASPK